MISSVNSSQQCTTRCNALANQPKKSVSFSESARMRQYIHINNFSLKEIEASWFTKAELSQSRKEVVYTIELMTSGEDIDESKYCTRGLECRTPQGAAIKNQKKIAAWDRVMEEQHKQYRMGINDEDSLAMVYIQCSFSCQVSAAVLAASDARSSFMYSQSRKRQNRRQFLTRQ
jgi:hypothetical protein